MLKQTMYVISLSDGTKWLINPIEKSKILITDSAIEHHNLFLLPENKEIDESNEVVFKMIESYMQIDGICDYTPPTETQQKNEDIFDVDNYDILIKKTNKIYEYLGKIKQNISMIQDVKVEMEEVSKKGLKVGLALNDLNEQLEDLMHFEKLALEELNNIKTLDKMMREQINALEIKCETKSNEICPQ